MHTEGEAGQEPCLRCEENGSIMFFKFYKFCGFLVLGLFVSVEGGLKLQKYKLEAPVAGVEALSGFFARMASCARRRVYIARRSSVGV